MNGRWAMLAFPGIIATEAFGYGNWIDAPNWVRLPHRAPQRSRRTPAA